MRDFDDEMSAGNEAVASDHSRFTIDDSRV
jgi:hypothetical protein